MTTEPRGAVTGLAADLALAQSEVAADLALRQAEAANKAAYERGRREAQVDARLDGHEAQLLQVKSAVAHQTSAMADLGGKFDELNGSFREHIAVETALASALETATSRGISAKAHYVSLGLFLAAVAGLIIGIPHH